MSARFVPQNKVQHHYDLANEFIVSFEPREQKYHGCQIMRKNIIYPGRYIMTKQCDYLSTSLFLQIGTFKVHKDE